MSELFDQDTLPPFETARTPHPDRVTNLTEGLAELRQSPFAISDIEDLATLQFVTEVSDLPTDHSLHRYFTPKFPESKISAMQAKLTELVEPLVGHTVTAKTNAHCELGGEEVIEITEDFTPKIITGLVTGTWFGVTTYKENTRSRPTAKHYRMCIVIGSTAVPLDTFDGSWNNIAIVDRPTIF